MCKYSILLFFLLIPVFLKGQFSDVTDDAGIRHGHTSGSLIGGGVSIADINQDGWDDIILAGGVGDDVIYLNNRNFTFSKVEEFLPQNRYGSKNTSSMVSADLDADGCLDIFVANSNCVGRNYLLKGDCSGRFEEISLSANIIETAMSVGAIITDLTGDGLPDIYVLNYIDEEGFIVSDGEVIGYNHVCAPNFLYVNLGNMTFAERAEEWNVADAGCSLAAQVLNIENQEALYVANDFGEWLLPNQLYIREGDRYLEMSKEYGLDEALFGMGIAVGDLDADLDEDVYVSNIGANPLLLNSQDHFTSDRRHVLADSLTADTSAAVGWGTAFFDYDLDGDLDVIIANGDIASASFLNVRAGSSIHLYENHAGSFNRHIMRTSEPIDGKLRGLALSDFDHDGDQDIVIGNTSISIDGERTSGVVVLKNESESNNWISLVPSIDLQQENIKVIAMTSDNKILRSHYVGGSHISQHDAEIIIGTDEESIKNLKLYFSNGDSLTLQNPPMNQRLFLQSELTEPLIIGCTNPEASDFNPLATYSITCEDITTSTKGLNKVNIEFSIYPTIVDYNANVNTEYPKGQLQIIDNLGRLRLQKTVSSKETVLDCSTLSMGSYSVVWYYQGTSYTERLFIVR